MKSKLLRLGLLGLLTPFVLSACDGRPDQREVSAVTVTVPGRNDATLEQAAPLVFDCDAVFFGDSITADGNFDALFPRERIVNLGVYADTLEDLLRRVPQLRELNPARIFLLGGINSLRDDNLEACVDQYRRLLQALQSACPRARLVVQSVLPVGAEIEALLGCSNETIRAFNLRLQALAEEFSLPYVELWQAYEKDGALDSSLTRDGVHLNFDVYGPWAELIRPYMEAPTSPD